MSNGNRTSPKRAAPGWHDVPGIANLLGVTEGFFRSMVYRREIPHTKIGKFIRFDSNETDQCHAERRVEALFDPNIGDPRKG